jgi:hypothetical protein
MYLDTKLSLDTFKSRQIWDILLGSEGVVFSIFYFFGIWDSQYKGKITTKLEDKNSQPSQLSEV